MQFNIHSQPQNIIFRLSKLDRIRLLQAVQTIHLVQTADKMVGVHAAASSVAARSNKHKLTSLFPVVQKRLVG
jgi:hypothetical protein